MPECIFCKIAKKEIPAKIRYEDDNFIAFDDINKKASQHILIIPKKHLESISTLKNDEFSVVGKMVKIAKYIAIKENIDSFRLVFNNGKDAGMEVDHLHLHLLGGGKLKGIA